MVGEMVIFGPVPAPGRFFGYECKQREHVAGGQFLAAKQTLVGVVVDMVGARDFFGGIFFRQRGKTLIKIDGAIPR